MPTRKAVLSGILWITIRYVNLHFTEIGAVFATLRKSRYRSYVWTEALSGFPAGAKPIWYSGNIAQRNKLHAINYLPQSTFTAMIRFSARGAYLLWYLKGRHLFGTGRSFLFLRNNRMLKNKTYNYFKRVNNRNCNSNKYTENVQLTWETQTKTTVFVMWHHRSFERY